MQKSIFIVICIAFIATASSNLKWFGPWGVSNPAETASWSNLMFDSANVTVIKQAHANNVRVLYNTLYIFVNWTSTGLLLKTTYEQDWNTQLPLLRDLLQQNIIFGFFLGDELCWNGLPYSNLTAMAALIRNTFP